VIAFLLKYFFSHHRMEKAQAQQGAEEQRHKPREEREGRGRREHGEREGGAVASTASASGASGASGGRSASRAASGAPSRPSAPEGQVRVWVNLGKGDGLDEAGLGAALEGAGAPASKIARTELRGTYSYLFVSEADAAAFEAVSGKVHGEKALKVERAKRR